MPLGENMPDILPHMETAWRQAPSIGENHGTLRDRIVPMIASAMSRNSMLGLDLIGWDMIVVPMQNAMLIGVAIAVRGMDLVGPGKELMQFRPFPTWKPTQEQVDELVGAIIEGLREARAQQASARR